MADLNSELQKLIDSMETKQKAYDGFLEMSKNHNDKIISLAEAQPIDILEFEAAEELYNEMTLSEKTYRVEKEVYNMSRRDVISKLTPVQNIKIKFTHTNKNDNKEKTEYYVWLKYNPENPDESQLVLQKVDDEHREPQLL